FGPQLLPAGCVISVVGPGAFPVDGQSITVLLMTLNDRVTRVLIDASVPAGEETESGGVPARHYGVGLVQRLPSLGSSLDREARTALQGIGEHLVAVRAALDDDDETSRRFRSPSLLRSAEPTLLRRIHAS